ncbi:MAG: hypothetical protein ACYDG6_11365 [Thermincolia bacterium]
MKYNREKFLELLSITDQCVIDYGFKQIKKYCVSESDCDSCWRETLNKIMIASE